MTYPSGWNEKGSATNDVASATKAASTGESHIVYSVDASFSATANALLQIKDGTDVVWEGYVYDKDSIPFPRGITITEGNACSAELAAGGPGTLGKVNLHGVSV